MSGTLRRTIVAWLPAGGGVSAPTNSLSTLRFTLGPYCN